MIFVLAGTRDGRELAAALQIAGYEVTASVVSAYGRSLVQSSVAAVNDSPLDLPAMRQFIATKGVSLVVDATHPYAGQVSETAIAACKAEQVPYIRYERPTVPLPQYRNLHLSADAAEAAKLAASLGQTVFLTTGSRTLGVFRQEPLLCDRCVIARVLPDPAVITQCIDLGFAPRDIVAAQGPFSHGFNAAMFREFAVDVVVTKNSGSVGGSDTKFSAAMELGLHLVVIERPTIQYPAVVYSLAEALQRIGEVKHE